MNILDNEERDAVFSELIDIVLGEYPASDDRYKFAYNAAYDYFPDEVLGDLEEPK